MKYIDFARNLNQVLKGMIEKTGPFDECFFKKVNAVSGFGRDKISKIVMSPSEVPLRDLAVVLEALKLHDVVSNLMIETKVLKN